MLHAMIVMDKSGSMSGLRDEAISHFNETVETIRDQARKESVGATVTLITFNHEATEVFYKADIDALHSLDPKDYQPNGSTALNDALGHGVTKLERDVAPGDRVVVSIVSDGHENASREFNAVAVKDLVERLSKGDWTFMHLGARQNLGDVAKAYGFDPSNVSAFSGSAKGLEMSTGRVQNAMRSAVGGQSMGLYAQVDSDHEARYKGEEQEP